MTALLGWMLAAMLLAGCGNDAPAGSPGELSGTLVVALLPDENPGRQVILYDPLVRHLREVTGLQTRLVIPASYDELVTRFTAREFDLAYFGGYTFALASDRAGAVPIAMRDIDPEFVSYVLVPQDSDAHGLADLRGKRFAFGAPLSTSGHIMPRYFLERLDLDAETLFGEVRYSGAHDRTVTWVAEGIVDAGMVNGQVARRMMAAGESPAPVRILWQSPPYVDYVWAVQPSMTPALRRRLTKAFLSLTRAEPEHRRFLRNIGARHFLPASTDDFDRLREAIARVRPGDLQGR